MTTEQHRKITLDASKEAFLSEEWNSFHLSGKKVDQLHLKEFPHVQI
jgi:hypothetical protein